ncbi:MAG: DUF4159 domain-containing protein [Candidatus Brocadiia bacterium]
MSLTSANTDFAVPDRGIRRPTIGFSRWLEYVLAGGLSLLFMVGVLVESYHEGVFNNQLNAMCALTFAAIAFTILFVDRPETKIGLVVRTALGLAALTALGWAGAVWIPRSVILIGRPHIVVRLLVYVAFASLGFWAWACWLWLYGMTAMNRAIEGPGGKPGGREKHAGREAFDRIKKTVRRVDVEKELESGLPDTQPTADLQDVAFAVLDPFFLMPKARRWNQCRELLSKLGHRVIDASNPVAGDDYDQHRMAGLKSLVPALFFLVMLAGALQLRGCRHETPKGILKGTGKRIAKGRVPVQRKQQKKKRKKQKQKKKRKKREKVRRESVFKLFKQEMQTAQESLEYSEASITEDAGLPSGEGKGQTAAGSPRGTKIGGKYYFYRVKYRGGNWDANRRGIPALMRHFTKVVNVKTNKFDQPIKLSNLPKHSGKYKPVLLYMTGNGRIGVSQQEIKNLRNYLENGGFLFADSSGGNFYDHFFGLMRRVFPGKSFRTIAYDHIIFRGAYMPYSLPQGCPIYREHRGAGPAKGLFMNDRLAVFYSGGDLGAAWATVGWGRNAIRTVELAFRMGCNIISYAFIYGGEIEEGKEES